MPCWGRLLRSGCLLITFSLRAPRGLSSIVPRLAWLPPLCRRIEDIKLGRLGQTKLVYDAGWDLFAYVGLSQQLRIREGGTTRTVGLNAIIVSCPLAS